MRWKPHVRFGERARETDQQKCRHRALARLHAFHSWWTVAVDALESEPDFRRVMWAATVIVVRALRDRVGRRRLRWLGCGA